MQHEYFDDEWDPTAPVFYSDGADGDDDNGVVGVPAAPVWSDGDQRAEAALRAELKAVREELRRLGPGVGLARRLEVASRVREVSVGLSGRVSSVVSAGADGGFGAGGVSGGGGLVRAWFGVDHRLVKVRISPVWFDKLRPGQTLGQLFTSVFRRYALSLSPAPVFPDKAENPADVLADRPLGIPLSDYLAVLDAHRRLRAHTHARARARVGGDQSGRVVGRFAGVEVELSEAGLLDSAWFDEVWLERTQVGKVRDAVVAAAADAFSRYRPVPRSDQVVAAVGGEHDVLLAGLKSFIGY
ncbi:hypothetical protein [Tessaracoccus sp. OH4464_COT-324]|uniref:hypothetical protein n=1 Tax=Tessaracoccus sp. OH4464_COT-324 TaxID=2491059 RepID=UPI000F637B57|nr:hypothetical protein [Tessaracoccus sp. OH4464_COT-324]RRD45694.1 hypothetical protein EII42_10600 [Tessaracoccus sp. OH4464_COT-324]